jgi:hypothetical protein
VQALAKREVGDFLSKHFVSVYDRVGTFQVNVSADGKTPNRNGGNVAAFFCTPNGNVIHVAAGPRTAEAFLAEAKWAVAVYSQSVGDRPRGLAMGSVEQGSRVTAALRRAHSSALDVLTKPNPFAPDLELIHHQPSSDPKLRGLEQGGLKQREQVHRLLKTRAYEPLAVVGPEVYTNILGEKVTEQPVQLTGAPEARQAARPGQSLAEFFAEGGSDKLIEVKPVQSPPPKAAGKGQNGSKPRQPSRGGSWR